MPGLRLDKSINITTMKTKERIREKIKAVHEVCVAGKTIEHCLKLPSGNHKGKRSGRMNVTSEAVRKNNDRIVERNIRRLINANFCSGDSHITLTYGNHLPTQQEAKRDLGNFIKRLRRRMAKDGAELKYIAVTEYENHRIHHHIVVNTGDTAMVNSVWGKGWIHSSVLDDSGEYGQLASYLIKETQKTFRDEYCIRSKRYTHSLNLVKPVVKRDYVEVSRLYDDPEPIPGYYIDPNSVRRYEHPVTGLEHLEYIEIALDSPRKYKSWPKGRVIRDTEKFTITEYNEQTSLFSREF